MSEAQENSRSHEAQEEINEANYQQQITNTTSGLVEERVKVDRKRFEQMLSEGSTVGCDADSFFRRVMRSTNTQIMWPPKLKPGTKSKKDPHVRITGSPNSIKSAKEIIFEQLDTRRNRVTLKMDVAFTDHSHIIGKGGRSIQRVMDETGCHIHFPDSNRTNTAEKSNQVSIAGSAEGVEQSRCRIREMLPITLQFDLPLNTGLHSPPTLDPQSPQLQTIQQSYGITITFRCDGSKCNNNSYFASSRIITVAVRGARSHLFGLRQGLSVLIEYLTGFRANSINIPLTMTIDVAVQHHSFIAGRANCNIRSIMESTGAVISLPDLNSLQQQQQSGASVTATVVGAASSPLTSLVTSNSSSSINTNSLSNNNNSASPAKYNNLSRLFTFDLNNNNNSSSTSNNMIGTLASSSSSICDLTLNNQLCGQQPSFMTNNNNNHGSTTNLSTSNQTFYGSNPNLAASMSAINNRKTAIVIKGPNFESVYSAWQELLGYLPLILIFDLKEGQDLDAVQVTKLMEQMRQISILIKPKQRQNTKSIVVRGPEKDSRLLFEVRKQILKLDDSEMPNFITTTSNSNNDNNNNELHQHQQVVVSSSSSLTTTNNKANSQQQQQSSTTALPPTSINSQSIELQMKAIKAILEPNLEKSRHPTPYWAGLGFSKSVSEPMIKEKLSIGPLFSSNLVDERRISYSNENNIHDLCGSLQSLSIDQHNQQASSSSKVFTDLNNNMNILASLNNLNIANNNNNNNTATNNSNNNTNNICNSMMNNCGSHNSNNNNMIMERKSTISNMMESNNNNSGISNHNNSASSSNSANNNQLNNNLQMTNQNLNVSNNQKISSCLRLAVFLGRIGLVQYLGLFTQHDIDLEMLLSLTENDFIELGLPYIHRRKLAIAIAEIKSSIQQERTTASAISSLSAGNLSSTFDAAPGAERSKLKKARCSIQGELSDIWSM